jgi:hypothetical protein
VLWIEVVHHPQLREYLGAGSRPEVTAKIAEPEEVGDRSRIQWVSGRPGEAPAYAGTDFIIGRDGRIIALDLFFDKLP